jgi:hypothetical protein
VAHAENCTCVQKNVSAVFIIWRFFAKNFLDCEIISNFDVNFKLGNTSALPELPSVHRE